jgi:7-carboxy-7-deazaguanine synthase
VGTKSSDTPLVVSEVFGPTVQGEGPSVGTPCAFLRLGGCNQHCVWCDTPYTWAFSRILADFHQDKRVYDPRVELKKMSDTEVVKRLLGMGVEMLVISGGEPMLQQDRILRLLSYVQFWRWRIEIETAGTIPVEEPASGKLGLADHVSQFNVSLKLENSGNPFTLRHNEEAINSLIGTGKAVWKFVVSSNEDWDEIDALVHEYSLSPVFIMPEGRDVDTLRQHAQEVVQGVIARGWRMTPRMQIDIWGNTRGH